MSGRILAAGFAALALGLLVTPLAIRLAPRLRLMDVPGGWKSHERATPLMGGLAIVLAFGIATAALGVRRPHLMPLIGGALLLCACGLLDDRRMLPATPRVLVECGAAAWLWADGWGWHLGAGGLIDLLLTVAWVIGVVNAINLIDLMDGVATLAVVVCMGAAGALVLAHLDGNAWLGITAFATAGAAAGFLPYNLARPSRIFLGDGGTMPLGFICAAVTMAACQSAAKPLPALLTASLLLLVPGVDMAYRIVVRVRAGVSLLTPGRDSLMNRLQHQLHTVRAVCLATAAFEAAIATVAVATLRLAPDAVPAELIAILCAAGFIILWAHQPATVVPGPITEDASAPTT